MNPAPAPREPWIPNYDVFVNARGDLVIELELSHLRREDLTLEVDGDGLRVSGKRKDSADPPPARYMVCQISRGQFSCTVDIAEGFAVAEAKACYQNGILRICVPPSVRPVNRLRLPPESD